MGKATRVLRSTEHKGLRDCPVDIRVGYHYILFWPVWDWIQVSWNNGGYTCLLDA
jgi:hypothetical protein